MNPAELRSLQAAAQPLPADFLAELDHAHHNLGRGQLEHIRLAPGVYLIDQPLQLPPGYIDLRGSICLIKNGLHLLQITSPTLATIHARGAIDTETTELRVDGADAISWLYAGAPVTIEMGVRPSDHTGDDGAIAGAAAAERTQPAYNAGLTAGPTSQGTTLCIARRWRPAYAWPQSATCPSPTVVVTAAALANSMSSTCVPVNLARLWAHRHHRPHAAALAAELAAGRQLRTLASPLVREDSPSPPISTTAPPPTTPPPTTTTPAPATTTPPSTTPTTTPNLTGVLLWLDLDDPAALIETNDPDEPVMLQDRSPARKLLRLGGDVGVHTLPGSDRQVHAMHTLDSGQQAGGLGKSRAYDPGSFPFAVLLRLIIPRYRYTATGDLVDDRAFNRILLSRGAYNDCGYRITYQSRNGFLLEVFDEAQQTMLSTILPAHPERDEPFSLGLEFDGDTAALTFDQTGQQMASASLELQKPPWRDMGARSPFTIGARKGATSSSNAFFQRVIVARDLLPANFAAIGRLPAPLPAPPPAEYVTLAHNFGIVQTASTLPVRSVYWYRPHQLPDGRLLFLFSSDHEESVTQAGVWAAIRNRDADGQWFHPSPHEFQQIVPGVITTADGVGYRQIETPHYAHDPATGRHRLYMHGKSNATGASLGLSAGNQAIQETLLIEFDTIDDLAGGHAAGDPLTAIPAYPLNGAARDNLDAIHTGYACPRPPGYLPRQAQWEAEHNTIEGFAVRSTSSNGAIFLGQPGPFLDISTYSADTLPFRWWNNIFRRGDRVFSVGYGQAWAPDAIEQTAAALLVQLHETAPGQWYPRPLAPTQPLFIASSRRGLGYLQDVRAFYDEQLDQLHIFPKLGFKDDIGWDADHVEHRVFNWTP